VGIKNSLHAQHLTDQGGPFNRLVANSDAGGNPEKGPPNNTTIIRRAWMAGNMAEGARPSFNGIQVAPGAADPRPTGTLTVADNDFSTGPCIVQIGDFEFIPGVDFAVGALAANTADNFRDALLEITGWFASTAGAVLTFRYPHPGRIRFEVHHHGTITNMTPLVPLTGRLSYGGTATAAPGLTT
jgi:hypothetical protein